MEDFYSDLEYNISFDLPADSNVPAITASDANVPLESTEDVSGLDSVTETAVAESQKPYLSKRPHRKSRAGCKQCKKRKVKCDEVKPSCKACTLRKEKCIYPTTQPPSGTRPLPVRTTDPLVAPSREESVDYVSLVENDVLVVSEPLFLSGQTADVIDMKMLWFYTTFSFQSFSINSGRSTAVDYALKIKVVEHAFRSPFLMETLKGLSALHLRTLNQPVPAHKIASYQARAFHGYRTAIEAANPVDFPALLACSLFMITMSSQTFRDPNGKRLFIVEWIALWRGIGLIVELITPRAVQDSGLAPLFYRPPIDLERAAQHIPNNLLFMVTSIKYGDDDYEYQKDYYELLRYLGSLYMELKEHGFGPVLDLRIITYFSFCPRPLLPLAKQLRPRMLVIIAYWLCFAKLLNSEGPWWMKGLSPHIRQVIEEVGEEWGHLLRVPQMVLMTDDDDRTGMAKLIIDNHNWTPSELDLYDRNRDPRARTELKFINNDGSELEIADGHWRLKATGARWEANPSADPTGRPQGLLLGVNTLHDPTSQTASSTSSTPGLSPSQSSSARSLSP